MFGGHSNTEPGGWKIPAKPGRIFFLKKGCPGKRLRGTLRFWKNYVSFLMRRTFRFADYTQDPFNINGIADYQIVEFTPTMFCDDALKTIL